MNGNIELPYQLEDCVVGEQKQLTILVTPTMNEAGGFSATVDEVIGYEHEQEKPAEEMPMHGKGMRKGMAPAVAIVIGKGK